mmetsp:Transcript_5307/g.10139  ORF Transcript_5307/g.10139 Transcript_5307/m.10139 type:complete len:232 (-) Transcript_5307:128-823(-)
MKEISACAHINMTNDQKHILKSHMSDHALEKLGFHTIVDLFPQHADELETLEMSTFVQLCHSSMCRFDLRTYDNDGIKFQSRPRAQHPLLPLHPQPPFPLLWQQTPHPVWQNSYQDLGQAWLIQISHPSFAKSPSLHQAVLQLGFSVYCPCHDPFHDHRDYFLGIPFEFLPWRSKLGRHRHRLARHHLARHHHRVHPCDSHHLHGLRRPWIHCSVVHAPFKVIACYVVIGM